MIMDGGGYDVGLQVQTMESWGTYVIELLRSHCIVCVKVKEDNVRMQKILKKVHSLMGRSVERYAIDNISVNTFNTSLGKANFVHV